MNAVSLQPSWVSLEPREAVNRGERRETLEKDNIRDNGFSVVRWTFSSGEAILHRTLILFYFLDLVILLAWPDSKKVMPKCSRDIALLFMWSCVTHCAGACLRWSYCEFRNCHPRPWLSHRLTMKLPLLVSYCTVQSHVRKQRFLVQCCWWH